MEITEYGEWKDVIDAVVEVLDEVDGVENIITKNLNFKTLKELKKHTTVYLDRSGKRQINAWFVERGGVGDQRGGRAAGVPITQAVRTDTIAITGLYGYQEGGQTTYEFQEIVERVMNALLANVTLNRGGERGWNAEAARAPDISLSEFGDVLSHIVDIEINVRRNVDVQFK